jgi:hypothetical protein
MGAAPATDEEIGHCSHRLTKPGDNVGFARTATPRLLAAAASLARSDYWFPGRRTNRKPLRHIKIENALCIET